MRKGRGNRKKREVKPKIAIVGDGYTEKIYFEQVIEDENIIHVDVKPDIPDMYGGYLKAIQKTDFYLDKGYDFVYCLIDLDKVITDGRLKFLEKEIIRLEKGKRCKVVLCNPCFEIWFLLHFSTGSRMFKNYSDLEKILMKHMPAYSKEINFLKKYKIYKQLKESLPTNAIPNSIRLENNQTGMSVNHARCQVHYIFQGLLPDDNRFYLKEKLIRNRVK